MKKYTKADAMATVRAVYQGQANNQRIRDIVGTQFAVCSIDAFARQVIRLAGDGTEHWDEMMFLMHAILDECEKAQTSLNGY